MLKFDLTQYQKAVDQGDVVSTFKSLKALYTIIDEVLSSMALTVIDTPELTDAQNLRLAQKDMLIEFALKIKCSNVHEISQKVDFLNLVHLAELNTYDLSDGDRLTLSIWEDCQSFL